MLSLFNLDGESVLDDYAARVVLMRFAPKTQVGSFREISCDPVQYNKQTKNRFFRRPALMRQHDASPLQPRTFGGREEPATGTERGESAVHNARQFRIHTCV